MKARHGITPIPLPAIQTSPTGIGRLSRETRKALAALRDRKIIVSGASGRGGVSYAHPFKLFTAEEDSEIRLFVYHGAITALDWSGAAALPSFNDLNPIIGMAQTYDDPFGGTVGHLVLSVSTTYGVWIRLGRSSGSHTSTDPEFDTVLSQGFAGSAVIITDETNIDPDDDWTYSGSYSYIFIGQVAVDAEGIATIKQHLKSDLVIPLASTLPNDIVHPET
jgi:hypothetical protein